MKHVRIVGENYMYYFWGKINLQIGEEFQNNLCFAVYSFVFFMCSSCFCDFVCFQILKRKYVQFDFEELFVKLW